jgi:hypothetical protein
MQPQSAPACVSIVCNGGLQAVEGTAMRGWTWTGGEGWMDGWMRWMRWMGQRGCGEVRTTAARRQSLGAPQLMPAQQDPQHNPPAADENSEPKAARREGWGLGGPALAPVACLQPAPSPADYQNRRQPRPSARAQHPEETCNCSCASFCLSRLHPRTVGKPHSRCFAQTQPWHVRRSLPPTTAPIALLRPPPSPPVLHNLFSPPLTSGHS